MSTQRTKTTATTPSSTAAPVPHRYQYPLDVPRIFRLLRPLKAKISAIELAIKSAPSYGYTTVSANSNNSNSSNNIINGADDNRTTTTNTIDRRERYVRRSGHSSAQHEEQEAAMTKSASAKSGRDLLIKRFQGSLTEVFKELFDKYWWRPICDDYDLPLNSSLFQVLSKGIKPSQYTLGMTCAFAVGRVIAGLPDDEAVLVDKYYSIVPESMRRFALLEHAVRMCTSLIPIKDMLKQLAEVCVRYRADAQAMHILEHLLVNQDETFQLDYRWAYIAASRVDSAEAWVKIWTQKAPVSFFISRQFSAHIREIPQHGVTLIQASVRIHMSRISVDLPESTRRARSVRFAASLIEESLKVHERLAEGHGSVPQSTLVTRREKYDRGIEHLARILFEEHELEPESWRRSVALALTLHSLYGAVATSSESTTITDGMSSWVELLQKRATVGICASDFNVIVLAYGTLTNLNALALMLDAVGLYSLSMTLVDRMLADFYELEDASCHQLGYPCDITIQSLKSFQKELEQREMQLNCDNGWIYDDVMETWVEMSPPAKKSEPHPKPHSSVVLRHPLQYSLTPVRWSNRLGGRLGRDGKNETDAESEPGVDEAVYDAPIDLEVLARFTIEEDSENENRPGHERPPSPDSESEYNSSDNAAHRSDTTSSESDPSDEEDGGPTHVDALDGDDEVFHGDENDDEAMARPSRRRRQVDNTNASVLSPEVTIINDSTGHSNDDFLGSDGGGSSSSNEENRFILSDNNSQDSNVDSTESIVARAPKGRCRQVPKLKSKDRGNRKDGVSGEDMLVISDDDGDSSQESVDEASQESDWQPTYRKRSRQRSSQHRHALNTLESEPDSDAQDEDDVPVRPRKLLRQVRGRNSAARQEKHRTPPPPPSPPQESSKAPSKTQLRKKRPRSNALSASLDSSDDDDCTASDGQLSIKKPKSRPSHPSSSQPRAKPVASSSSVSRPATEPNVMSRTYHPSSDHHATKVVPGSSEDFDMDDFVNTRPFKSNARSTPTYNALSVSASHSDKGLTMEARSISHRKRVIIIDDDESDDGQNHSNRDRNLAPAKSTWQATKGLEMRKAATESDDPDSPPRTKPRPRAVVAQSHTRKRNRVEDNNDVVSGHWNIFDESGYSAPARNNGRSSRESGGSESSKVKSTVAVVEDMGDDVEVFKQDWSDRRRTIHWPQTPTIAHTSSSRQPPTKKTSRIEIPRFFVL
ncbi:hypothetical protein EC957_000948 [Mortierella hygrophila]|uniref:Uncharacterized protein n=1 Tax=Mortierella hygrophila TaxID=979708 RepID=A0A9P6F650_9FUNG|nr:hypothetical protein EC957_000948 [Mortierella hygrophila]